MTTVGEYLKAHRSEYTCQPGCGLCCGTCKHLTQDKLCDIHETTEYAQKSLCISTDPLLAITHVYVACPPMLKVIRDLTGENIALQNWWALDTIGLEPWEEVEDRGKGNVYVSRPDLNRILALPINE